MQEPLLEAELFGVDPGGFTGAVPREGKVRSAAGGTLMLDEIAELAPTAQAKLLQLLQSKTFFAVGGDTPQTADVRIIAATNADLKQAMAARRFREDLYHRLNVYPLRMPTLTERREDVAELAAFFCEQVCAGHRLPHVGLSRGALRALEAAEWPGNVRQLGNCITAAVIRAAGEGLSQIERHHLFPEEPPVAEAPQQLTFQEATRRFQKELLTRVLEETEYNVVETARRLDLARAHVYNLMRAFGLKRER
jgi:Nif-specific regulatory protein